MNNYLYSLILVAEIVHNGVKQWQQYMAPLAKPLPLMTGEQGVKKHLAFISYFEFSVQLEAAQH